MTTTLGGRIAALRVAKGLTQSAVAAEVDIGRSTLASIEKGHDNPGRDTLQAMATFFEVSMDYLTGGGVQGDIGRDKLVQDQLFQIQQAWPRIDAEGRLAIATLVRKLAAAPRRKSA